MNKITPQGSKRETSPRGNDTSKLGSAETVSSILLVSPHMLSQHEMSMPSQHGMRKIATFSPHFFHPNFSIRFWMKTITGN